MHIHFVIFSAGERWLNYNERTFCHNAGQLQQLSDPLNCVGGTESSFHARLYHVAVVRSPLWPVAGLFIMNISFYVRTGSSDTYIQQAQSDHLINKPDLFLNFPQVSEL